jgi:hypothetical protein
MTTRTEEEKVQSVKAVSELAERLLKVCEMWTYEQPGNKPASTIMAECVTAALQVGLVMAARLGLPQEKLAELYAAEIELSGHPKDCPHCVEAQAELSGKPDPKAN